MNEEAKKFQEEISITYETFFQIRYDAFVSVAKKFEPYVGKEKMLELLEELAIEKSIEDVKQRMKDKEITKFEDFKKIYKELLDSEFAQKTAVWEIIEDSPKKLTFHYKECLWAKTMKELNATDIGFRICCQPDYAIATAYHPKVKLTRTKTIMEGNNCCDHTYTWEE